MVRTTASTRLCMLMTGLLALGLSCEAREQGPADSFDVLGVRLGMTHAEVEAIAVAYDPKAKMSNKLFRLSYFDGWESRSTDDFIKTMSVQFPDKGGSLEVEFSSPAAGARVTSITRKGGYSGRKIEFSPYENFLQSLIKKYGEPVLERRRGVGGELLWSRPRDGKICLEIRKSLSLKFSEANYDLSEPGNCARLLYYDLEPDTPGGPVERLSATAIDVAEIVRAQQATEAWLKKLSDEARASRSKATPGDEPDL